MYYFLDAIYYIKVFSVLTTMEIDIRSTYTVSSKCRYNTKRYGFNKSLNTWNIQINLLFLIDSLITKKRVSLQRTWTLYYKKILKLLCKNLNINYTIRIYILLGIKSNLSINKCPLQACKYPICSSSACCVLWFKYINVYVVWKIR
jgi:hypothetical protein